MKIVTFLRDNDEDNINELKNISMRFKKTLTFLWL